MSDRFEGFEVLEQARELHVGGLRVAIGARAFDVLRVLVRHHDRVVTKAELLDQVWAGQVVEEGNVQVQVSALRKLLGQQAIATVPGFGYRLTQRPLAPPPAGADHTVAAGTTGSADPPGSTWTAPNRRGGNLPLQLPVLHGRAPELARLRTLLAQPGIVSLVATGGVGKTHLARAFAASQRASHPDGVWWVELAALRHGDQVAAEIVRVLGYQVGNGRSASDTAIDILRRQRAMLLLDNCEHLLPAVAALAAAIHQAAAQLRILVTSQAPLKITGEQVLRLQPLALPADDSLDTARHSSAVQLLVHRIQAVQPGFALEAANAERVAALCRRLDGIPLALEFAAARAPVLGLDGLLARLDARFKLLAGGDRNGLRRHQTLRAALDFSHGLLSADEQVVLRRLGVFAGSFSADAAQAVCADAAIDHWSVLDHLGTLVDKSLVVAEPGEPPRLRLLETMREFALDRLAAAGETAHLQACHARATAQMLAQSADAYWQLSDTEFRARYAPEHANLRAALDWALLHQAPLAIELAGNACALWREALALQPEGQHYCEAALAHVDDTTPPLAAGRLLYTLGWMLIWSQQQRGRAAAQQAAELLRRTDDRTTLGMTLLLLIPGTTAPDAQQEAVLEELRQLHDPQSPPRVRAQYASARARLAMGARRYADAARGYAEARSLLRSGGSVQWEAVLAWTVAGIALTTGDLDGAAATLRDTADRLDTEPTRGIFLAFCLGSLATAELLRGDQVAARQALQRAAPLVLRFGLGSRYAGTAAGLAAQERRWRDAACLLGYRRAAAQASGVDAEEPAEVVLRASVVTALHAELGAAATERWQQEGSALTAEAAYACALATQEANPRIAATLECTPAAPVRSTPPA